MGKLIIDGIEVGGSSSASSVKYNNTNSTLVSTNVQGAIDELNSNLGGFSFRENPEQSGKYQYKFVDGSWLNFNYGAISIISAEHRMYGEDWAQDLGSYRYAYPCHIVTLYSTLLLDISDITGNIEFSGNLTVSVSNDNSTYTEISTGTDLTNYNYLKLYFTLTHSTYTSQATTKMTSATKSTSYSLLIK